MTLRVLSLGAGVQSTTMALMAAHGEIGPMPDCAIFADTGAEPKPVYEHLEWLMSENVLPFPVHIVQEGDLAADLMDGTNTTGHRFVPIPFFGRTLAGDQMMARRQCTSEYKIKPIRAKIRDILGVARPAKGSCEQWIGISLDEIFRVKPSQVQYIVNRHPLIEKRMRRWDCLRWLERHDYPLPPKSACTFCPFRGNDEWRWLQEHDPAGWLEAVSTDAALREVGEDGNWGRFDSELYLHRSLKPLAEVDLSTAEDRGQGNMFNNECEGMCGV